MSRTQSTHTGPPAHSSWSLFEIISNVWLRHHQWLVPLVGSIEFGLLSVYLGQDINWDLRNYHYYNPYAFLHGRWGIDHIPAMTMTFFNPLADLPFYFLVSTLSPPWVGFWMGAIHGLNFGLIYWIALLLFSKESAPMQMLLALLTANCAMTGAVGISELGTTFNDNFVSLPVLAALWLLVRSLHRFGDVSKRVWFGCAGLLGFGAGLKATTLIFAIGFLAAMVCVRRSPKTWLSGFALWMAGILAGASISYGFWGYRLWRDYGNPVFPLMNAVFKSPFFIHENISYVIYHPQNALQTWLFPFYFSVRQHLVSELFFRDARLASVYVLLLVWTVTSFIKLRWGNKRPGGPLDLSSGEISMKLFGFLVVFYVTSYGIWQRFYTTYRFAVVLEMTSVILIAAFLHQIIRWRNLRNALFAVLVLFLMGWTQPMDWGRLPWGRSFFGSEVPALPDPDHTLILLAPPRAQPPMCLHDPGLSARRPVHSVGSHVP